MNTLSIYKIYLSPFRGSRRGLLLLVILLWGLGGYAQELRCRVTVDARQAQISDRSIFKDMEKAMSDFMNTRKWTNDKFTAEERINCSITVTITRSPAIGFYEGTAQVQATRPIYGTNMESFVLNYVDRQWQFQFNQSSPLDVFNENIYNANLTSLLAYYAYIIIGTDYDSFAKFGGTPFFQQAFTIANNAQQGVQNGEKGWQAFDDTRNRYWLIENLQNQQMQVLRENNYVYHRVVLDNFREKPDEGRVKVVEVLQKMKQVNQIRPAAVLSNTFFDTKADELINLFSQGDPQQRQQAYNLLAELDPTNTDRYKALTENR
jgi:hypothetical protein